MYCCRNFVIPLLSTSIGSPFLTLSLLISFALQYRPCLYCSCILLILSFTSCYWRDTPILELTSVSDFFRPRAFSELDSGHIWLGWLRRFVGRNGELYNSEMLRVVL